MGDYSRDSFRETNALVNVLGLPAAPLPDARSYVGVRFQQGRPLLDAEFNEADDIRRLMQRTVGRFFLGTGAPVGSDGFRLSEAAPNADDFGIQPGVFLVEGTVVWNPAVTSYTAQPNADGQPQSAPLPTLPALPALVPPAAGERTDLVVLDAWVREVPPAEDARLVDPRVGLETTARLVQEWVVRVVTDVAPDADAVPDALRAAHPGHAFAVLGRIRRRAGAAAVAFDDLTDLRRTGLTLDRGEGPLQIYSAAGALEYDAADLAALFETAERVYGDVVYGSLFLADLFSAATVPEAVTLLDAVQDVKAQARLGAAAARRAGFGRSAALAALEALYGAQARFVDLVGPFAATPARLNAALFLDQVDLLLGERPAEQGGLRQALDAGHARDAVDAQLGINAYVGGRATVLPRGRLVISFAEGPPASTPLAPGDHLFVYDVTSEVSLAETYDVEPRIDGAPTWSVRASDDELTLEPGETAQASAVVTIPNSGSDTAGTLAFRVRSQVNPGGVDATNIEVELELGATPDPPAPIVLDLAVPSPFDPSTDEIDVPAAPVVPVQFDVTNTADEAVTVDLLFAFDTGGLFQTRPDGPLAISAGGTERVATNVGVDGASPGDTDTLRVTVRRADDPTLARELVLPLRAV